MAAVFHVAIIAWYYAVPFPQDDLVDGHLFGIIHRRHSFITNLTFEAALVYFIYHMRNPPQESKVF